MSTTQQESAYSKFRLRLSPYSKSYKCRIDIDNLTLEDLSAALALRYQGSNISKNVALVAYDERYIPKSNRDLQRVFRIYKELGTTEIVIIPFIPSILYSAVPQLVARCLSRTTSKPYSRHCGVPSAIPFRKTF